MNPFTSAAKSFAYPEFIQFTEELVDAGRTTGPDQSEKMVHYTKLNLHRMRRWNKTFQPNEELISRLRARAQSWWVITEPWCGDSAQSLPILAIIAEAAGVPFRIVLRDDNPEVMDKYLTAGTRSIPILVAIDEQGSEIFRWGPRPVARQEIVVEWKRSPGGKTYDELKEEVHAWYARDKGNAVQQEIMSLVSR